MGDAFDSRKSIDYQSLEWAKRVVFDPLKKYEVHIAVGNHDTYYKNTNEINSPGLLLQTYKNIKTYDRATEVTIGGLKVLIPGHGPASTNTKDTIKLTRNYLAFLRETMGAAVEEFIPFDEVYAATDWSQFKHLPAFDAGNRINAYQVYLSMEAELLGQ